MAGLRHKINILGFNFVVQIIPVMLMMAVVTIIMLMMIRLHRGTLYRCFMSQSIKFRTQCFVANCSFQIFEWFIDLHWVKPLRSKMQK